MLGQREEQIIIKYEKYCIPVNYVCFVAIIKFQYLLIMALLKCWAYISSNVNETEYERSCENTTDGGRGQGER